MHRQGPDHQPEVKVTTQTVPTSDDRSERADTRRAMAYRLRMPSQPHPSLDELLGMGQTWLRTGGIPGELQ